MSLALSLLDETCESPSQLWVYRKPSQQIAWRHPCLLRCVILFIVITVIIGYNVCVTVVLAIIVEVNYLLIGKSRNAVYVLAVA